MARTLSTALALCLSRVSWGALAQGEYELVAHLKQHNREMFEQLFWDIANPQHPMYLQFLTTNEIATIIGATDAAIASTSEWLVSLGAESPSLHVSALRDTVTATFHAGKLQSSLKDIALKKPSAVQFIMRRDPPAEMEIFEPERLSSAISDEYSGYTVSSIKSAYGIPTDLQASNDATTQMVWGPGSFGYSSSQLHSFKQEQCPLLNENKVVFDTKNHGTIGGDNFGEGNLDVTMIASFGLNVQTVVSNTNTSASTEEGNGFGQALLDFATELSSRETVPHVLSMSLGSLSAASCDLLCSEAVKMGHTDEECKAYMQEQRQVCMYLSQDQSARINTALQVLGTRGVSIFGSSGDGGSHFSFGAFPTWTQLGTDLNTISCAHAIPVSPTESPYIVSVGGTMWSSGSTSPVTWAGYGGGSGGGVSWQFDRPAHQEETAAKYFNRSDMPSASSFNPHGRAYPDVSAVGVSGTSQSCPITAGIFSMIIDHRLNAGLPPLGFLGTRIWQVAEQFPGEAFLDVTEGNSKTSCEEGFPATVGWDANTGWGRPIWDGMMKHFGSDSVPPEPTPTPTPSPTPSPVPPVPTPSPTPAPVPPTPTPSPTPAPVPPVEGQCIGTPTQAACEGTAQQGSVCLWCDFGSWGDCMPPSWACSSSAAIPTLV